MRHTKSWLAGLTGLLATIPLAGPTHAQPAQPAEFYAGKQLNVIVSLAPGGTVDTFVRMLAPYLKKRSEEHTSELQSR